MSVFNGGKYLNDAIKSILNQTFENFEFLIINDGSTDATKTLLAGYDDPRICVVHNEKNIGLARSLNKGLELARGKYVARMDSDDISLPQRLERQVKFMNANQNIAICGTFVRVKSEREILISKYPTTPADVKCRLMFGPSLAHPSAIFRTSDFNKFNLRYDPNLIRAQDYDLWVRASRHLDISNLNEVLLVYRVHDEQVSQKHKGPQKNIANEIRLIILETMGIIPTSAEKEIHQSLAFYEFVSNRNYVKDVDRWLRKLQQTNLSTLVFPEPEYSQMLAKVWFDACSATYKLGPWCLIRFWRSPLAWSSVKVDLKSRIYFTLYCLKAGIWACFEKNDT